MNYHKRCTAYHLTFAAVLAITFFFVLATLGPAQAADYSIESWRDGRPDYSFFGADGEDHMGDLSWVRVGAQIEDSETAAQDIYTGVITGRLYLSRTKQKADDTYLSDGLFGVHNLSLLVEPWLFLSEDEVSGQIPIGLSYVHPFAGGNLRERLAVGPFFGQNDFTNPATGKGDTGSEFQAAVVAGIDYQVEPGLLRDDLFQLGVMYQARTFRDNNFVFRISYNMRYTGIDVPMIVALAEEEPDIQRLAYTFFQNGPRLYVHLWSADCEWGISPFVTGIIPQTFDNKTYHSEWTGWGVGARVTAFSTLRGEFFWNMEKRDERLKDGSWENNGTDVNMFGFTLSYGFYGP